MGDSGRRWAIGVTVAVGLLVYFVSGWVGPDLLTIGLFVVLVFAGASTWVVGRARRMRPDLFEGRPRWRVWVLVVFIVEMLLAGFVIVATVFAALFALFFGDYPDPEFNPTPYLVGIAGFVILSLAVLVWAVRQWAVRSGSSFAIPFLVPVFALILIAVWNAVA